MEDDNKNTKTINNSIIENQLKYCGNILTRLKRNQNAGPFLQPVDPIGLGIPDYFDKIKKPMDISTVKNKLDNNEYKSPEEFDYDMILMFDNCYAYNSPESVVYEMGKTLQKAYEALYNDLPHDIVKKGKITNLVSPRLSDNTKTNPRVGDDMSMEDYSICLDMLKEVEKSKYSKFTWPFLKPVSEEEVPEYYETIKNPMDISTMRKKLEDRIYGSIGDFVGDFELIIQNCYKFNAPGSGVYECCCDFDKLIDEKAGKYRDSDARINEIRKNISELTAELRVLEAQKSRSKKVFTLNDREKIGDIIIGMGKNQTEKIAEIVQRHCAYEYIDNDEIELNMHTIPDDVLYEINEFIKKINGEDVRKED